MVSKTVLAPLLILFVLNILSVSLLSFSFAFTQSTTITIGPNGVSYYPASQCVNLFNGIPVLSNIFAIYTYIAGTIVNAFGGQANPCSLSQITAFVTYTYNPTSTSGQSFAIANFFVDLIPIVLVAVAFLGINVLQTGYNTGAVMVLVIGGALMLAWGILSGPVIAIFFAQSGSQPYALPVAGAGLVIYGCLTLIFTIGAIGMMGGSKDI